jgi:2-oxo-3-hexenedioate decarboxylase
MSLAPSIIAALAQQLEQAELSATPLDKITNQYPELGLEDAYAIQDAIRMAKALRGIGVDGLKMGLTSAAKIQQMGVTEPIHGFLNAEQGHASGSDIDIGRMIHPRVEAEIGFVLDRPLQGPGCHIGDVLAATAYVVAAVEIIDSRYRDFRFDVASVVADNTSAAGYVLGERRVPALGLDLKHLGIVLRKNGQVAATASGAAVLGHPAASVAMLANMLGVRGRAIPAGVLILSGGATEAVPVSAGDQISVDVQSLGSVAARFFR